MKSSPLRVLAAVCILAVGACILIFAIRGNTAGQKDFIEYWAAGQQLIHGADPYDGVAILQLERTAGFDANRPLITFSPPIALVWALPLGLVSAKMGVTIWLLALLACLVPSVRMLWILNGRPDNRIHQLSYCFAPILACLMAGQLGIFLLFGIVLFLAFHESHPFLAGTVLLPCALKPHLFLPFAIVLLLWALNRRSYRVLAGFGVVLFAGCVLVTGFDLHIWLQYAQMMSIARPLDLFIPTLSMMFRLLIDRNVLWLQFLPETGACIWAVWYFWTRRSRWKWNDQGLLLLLVSAACTPYAFFTDEAVLLPAVLAALYQAEESGRSILPFAVGAGIALIEVIAGIQITSPFYLWTVPAWLAWYLYATTGKSVQLPISELDGG